MALLNPQMTIMDETDSGLDIDALRVVAEGVNALRNPADGGNPNMGILIITHYQRILNYIKPDYVHLMVDGRIVRSGGMDLVETLEQEGYGELVKESLSPQEV
jgi:Fe-S cluster assembly ATP-binding protein